MSITEPTTSNTVSTEVSISHDPHVRRFFVLTTIGVEYGEPTPTVVTQTWAFSSQFKAVSRALQSAMKIILSRHNDHQETFDSDDSIQEDLNKLVNIIPICSGLNGYEESIEPEDLKLLLHCWEKISYYFRINNNIHDGTHHTFLLSRYIINDHDKKTFTREVNIHLSTEQQRELFLQ